MARDRTKSGGRVSSAEVPRRRVTKTGAACTAALLVVAGIAGDHVFNHGKASSAITGTDSIPDFTVGNAPIEKPQKNHAVADPNAASFAQLKASIAGPIGIAWAPVGRNTTVTQYGDWQSGPAWSTSKVIVSLALEGATNNQPGTAASVDLRAAITASDNEAINRIWRRLGSDAEAAAAANQILRDGGDTVTKVPSVQQRSGMATIFGQTEWSLENQTKFAANLPCLPQAPPVIDLMQQIIPKQSWGLGTTGLKTAFKDGWGPDPNGAFLTRQMGVVQLSDGEKVAMAFATKPTDGTFATGQKNITAMAQWAVEHVGTLPKGSC